MFKISSGTNRARRHSLLFILRVTGECLSSSLEPETTVCPEIISTAHNACPREVVHTFS